MLPFLQDLWVGFHQVIWNVVACQVLKNVSSQSFNLRDKSIELFSHSETVNSTIHLVILHTYLWRWKSTCSLWTVREHASDVLCTTLTFRRGIFSAPVAFAKHLPGGEGNLWSHQQSCSHIFTFRSPTIKRHFFKHAVGNTPPINLLTTHKYVIF